MLEVDTVLLKVASRCNIDCRYCYVFNMGDTGWSRRPNPTTEERLNALETGLTRLRTDLNAGIQTVTTSVEAVKQDVQREAAARTAAITDVLRQVEDVSAGGLHLQGIGLWWLVVGVLFTSVPNELATLLGPLLTLL